MTRLAILKPKFVPGAKLVKKDSVSFCWSWPSSGFGLAIEAEQPEGADDERDRVVVVELEVDEIFGVGDQQREIVPGRGRRLQVQVDVESDEMVGPLLHPIVAVLDRPELGRLAADLERGEIADLGQAAGVLARQRGENVARDQIARLGEPLGGEGRIHLVEHPVVGHRDDLAVGEADLAAHRHPDVGMGGGRRREQSASVAARSRARAGRRAGEAEFTDRSV